MSVYEWPLSPVYEIPPSSSSCFPEPISEIPEYSPSSPSSSITPTLIRSKSAIPNLLTYLKQSSEPQISTVPKHRLKKIRTSMTLRRILPSFTIFLIILTFTYLTVRDESMISMARKRGEGLEWKGYGYTYEKRTMDEVVLEEISGMGVPTGLVE